MLSCPPWLPILAGDCSCLPRVALQATVVDLDPKPLSKLKERPSVDNQIVEAFLAAVADTRQTTETPTNTADSGEASSLFSQNNSSK
ncbi:unnamed protein product [Protopolystoma xenopodis]|uniref:Inositol-pentakisphosphate 2-kinase n=1 Tax=Protopolystoma xenopodis TaxID=117903 RepID=A0A3S5AKP7_9PLAT|nr:unnamed protein product [Protopolystoma xenopodis]